LSTISLGGSGIIGISYGETSLLKSNLLRAKERRDSAASNANSAKMKLQVNGSSGRIRVEADNLQSYYSSIKNNNAKIDKVIRDIDYIVRRFKEVDSRCANRIKSIGRGYKVRSGISKIGNSLISFGNKVFNGISSFFNDGMNAIKSMGSSVKNWVSNYSFFGTSRLGNLNGVGYLGSGIPGVGLGCGLPAVSFNRDDINAIKSMGSSVKNWFSNYRFFGNSTLGNLNGVGYLGAKIPGVGLGCGLPAVSFNGDSLIYAGTSIHNKIKSFISSIGDKYNKWKENRDKNENEWLDYIDEENIYTWEDAKKYIEGGIWGSGLYPSVEIADLPKQIIYKKGMYTYVCILKENVEYFNGMPLNIGDPITLKDGTVIDTNLYRYEIVKTDEPKISAAPIFAVPNGLRVHNKVGDMNKFFESEFGSGSSLKGAIKPVKPEKVINDLSDYTSKKWNVDGNEMMFDKKGMKHVLERHHPGYWDGSVKAEQSFLNKNLSIDDIQNIAGEVISKNRDIIISKGTRGMYQIEGEVDGITYVVGFKNGRIGQIYPK
jgi:hypothetical protein